MIVPLMLIRNVRSVANNVTGASKCLLDNSSSLNEVKILINFMHPATFVNAPSSQYIAGDSGIRM
jgi:hypothetical protein